MENQQDQMMKMKAMVDQWHQAIANPAKAQENVLEGLLKSYSQTEYGRKHKSENVGSYADYKKVLNNSYFTTSKGQTGKFVSLNWVIESDFAEVDYWIQETYTKNLKEEFYEVT